MGMKWSKATSIGESKRKDGQYEEAITYFMKALEIARNNGSKDEEAKTLYLLAELYDSIEKYHEAVNYYEKGLLIVQDTGDKKLECYMCINLGGVYNKLVQYIDGMTYSKQGLDIALGTGDSKLIADSYNGLGKAYLDLYEYQNSTKCYNKAIDIYKLIQDEKGLEICYGNLSILYNHEGKYHNAIHFQEESLRIADKMGNKSGKVYSLLNLGTIHKTLKNPKKAVELYQQSLTIAKEIGHKGLQVSCHMALESVLNHSGNDEDVISCYLESLKIAEQLDDRHKLASINLNIGNYYRNIKQYQEAHEYYNNSLLIAKEINEKTIEVLTYQNLAGLHFIIGEFQQAISLSEKSLHIALSIENRECKGNACYLLGEIYYSLAKDNQDHETSMAKSEEYLKKALDCFDYLFSQLQRHDEFKISIFDPIVINTYKLLTTVYIETQQTQQALLVSDHGRARALGDGLIFKYGISQEEYLSSQPLTYPDVQNVLSKDAFTLLHYSLLRKSLAVWVVFKDSIEFKQTDKQQFISTVETLFGEKKNDQEDTINRFFTDTVTRAYEDMKITEGVKCENRSLDDCVAPKDQQCEGVTESVSRDGTSVEEPGQDSHPLEVLYNILVAPVLSNVQHDEIVIVPDGKMYTVPFAALIDPNTGQYLSETKRIRLVPSIAILKVLQECPADHHSQQGALIVGNPSVGEVMFRGKKKTFENLPSAKMEANCITRLLDNYIAFRRNAKITSLIGKQATKDVVLTKLKEGVAIIHIAAHGSADNGEIALAPIASQDRQGIPEEQDYLLTMKEVQQVGVKAQLVVLSCCHSGRGEIRAEGVVGLSRAFLAAGARGVVASLWAINDYLTLSFMVSFYECLCRGESASVSLDKAMKDIRKDHSDPVYWAPFFLIGDDVTI